MPEIAKQARPRSMPAMHEALASLDEDAYEAAPL